MALTTGTWLAFRQLVSGVEAVDTNALYQSVNWDVSAVPTFDGKTGPSEHVLSVAVVNTPSPLQSQKLALHVMRYMVSNEFQNSLARVALVPVLRTKDWQSKFAADYPKHASKNWNAVFSVEPMPYRKQGPYDEAAEMSLANYYVPYFGARWHDTTKSQFETLDKVESNIYRDIESQQRMNGF